MKNNSIEKIGQILDLASARFGKKLHLSRKKFIINFVSSLIESLDVQFSVLSARLNPRVNRASNLRRIQRFFAQYTLDYDQISCLMSCFLPQIKLTLVLDRTNWKFGQQNINILALTAYYKGIGMPLMFELLDKQGNSTQLERIDLLTRFIAMFGQHRIGAVIADREFIGQVWFKWLIDNDIPFYIRIREKVKIELGGLIYQIPQLVLNRKNRAIYGCKINDLALNVAIRSGTRQNPDGYFIIATNRSAKKALQIYKQRWSIEVFFQAIKSRGFNLERTHLTDLQRIKKLLALLSLAFGLCVQCGRWRNEYRNAPKQKNHGYPSNSVFRHGLDLIQYLLINQGQYTARLDRLLQWIYRKMTPIFYLFCHKSKIVM